MPARYRGVGQGIRRELRRWRIRTLYGGLEREWLTFLREFAPGVFSDYLRGYAADTPTQPYLRRWLNFPERVAILIHHYSLLARRLEPRLLGQLTNGPPIELSRFAGKSGREYVVELRQGVVKEGELNFVFREIASNGALADLHGTFVSDRSGGCELWLGGLQGPKPPVGTPEIVAATRDLSGLRPKHAVLHAACIFAREMGAATVVAPPRANHISHRWYRNIARHRFIHSNLEAFWGEFTERRNRRGDYLLPVDPPCREPESVPGKRRKLWLERHARLDRLTQDIVGLFAERRPGAQGGASAASLLNGI